MKTSAVLVMAVALLMSCATHSGTKRYAVPIDSSPQLGPTDAPVTIVEFMDFQ